MKDHSAEELRWLHNAELRELCLVKVTEMITFWRINWACKIVPLTDETISKSIICPMPIVKRPRGRIDLSKAGKLMLRLILEGGIGRGSIDGGV